MQTVGAPPQGPREERAPWLCPCAGEGCGLALCWGPGKWSGGPEALDPEGSSVRTGGRERRDRRL